MHGDQVPPLNGIRAGAPGAAPSARPPCLPITANATAPATAGKPGRDHHQAFDTSSDIGTLDRVNGAGLGFGQDRPAKTILSCVDHQQLLQSVELTAGLDRAGAQRAVTATLATLAERLGRPAAAGLAGGLPRQLRGPLAGGPQGAEPFDAGEFARRVGSRAGVSPEQGRQRARAVLATLGRTSPRSRRSATSSHPTTSSCSARNVAPRSASDHRAPWPRAGRRLAACAIHWGMRARPRAADTRREPGG
jgi:uncharacterized protein (DUF2267 family)